MKNSTDQDPRITRELGNYRLAPPSTDLHDRVLRAAREAMAGTRAELPWTDRWMRALGSFREEILTYASALLLMLGIVIQLGGGQNVLADTVGRLKVMATISSCLHRATSMDCTVMKRDAGSKNSRYRVRWNAAGGTRIDMQSTGGTEQTLWISKGTVSTAHGGSGTVSSKAIGAPPHKSLPAFEFLTPAVLAQHMEMISGLMQAEHPDDARPHEFLLVGQENHHVVEIAVDGMIYLPITLKKYSPDPARSGKDGDCIEEVRFQWNKPIPQELFDPKSSAAKR